MSNHISQIVSSSALTALVSLIGLIVVIEIDKIYDKRSVKTQLWKLGVFFMFSGMTSVVMIIVCAYISIWI